MLRRRAAGSFWVFGVALLAACAELVAPVANVNFLTVAQEREVADEFAREVEAQARVMRDPEVPRYVADIGARLAGALRDPEFDYTFRVIEDRSINAFNVGGGYVYVHTGLLENAATEGQVTSVLAHEIGHQVRRHVARAISREELFKTMANLAVGPNSSQWVLLAAGLGVTTGQLHFGREAEREADAVMVGLMTRAGYDPNEALAMFEKLRTVEGREPGKVAKLFSSHPPTSERIDDVRKRIARTELAPDLVRDSRRFHEAQRRLRDR